MCCDQTTGLHFIYSSLNFTTPCETSREFSCPLSQLDGYLCHTIKVWCLQHKNHLWIWYIHIGLILLSLYESLFKVHNISDKINRSCISYLGSSIWTRLLILDLNRRLDAVKQATTHAFENYSVKLGGYYYLESDWSTGDHILDQI